MTQGKKAFFLDIDGTLSYGGAAPEAQDIAALRAVRAQGHRVFINTGRAWGVVPPALKQVDYLDGYLCGCGSQLVMGDRLVFTREISRPFAREIIAFYLRRPQKMCLFESNQGAYALNGTLPELAECFPLAAVDDFETKYPQAQPVKLTVFGKPEAAEEEFFRGRLELVRQTSARWFEGILPGGGKGVGLERVCAYIGIPLENSVAIGDSDNDLDMFHHAGLAIAMENAEPPAVAACDYMTAACGQGGVARAVRAIALENDLRLLTKL